MSGLLVVGLWSLSAAVPCLAACLVPFEALLWRNYRATTYSSEACTMAMALRAEDSLFFCFFLLFSELHCVQVADCVPINVAEHVGVGHVISGGLAG